MTDAAGDAPRTEARPPHAPRGAHPPPPAPPKRSDLPARVAVAGVGIPLVVGAIWAGGWVLGLLMALVAAGTVRELYQLAASAGVRPFALAGTAATGALVLLAVRYPTPSALAPWFFGLALAVVLGGLGAGVWLRWPAERPLAAVSSTLTGVVYVGGALAFAPMLRALPGTALPGDASPGGWSAASLLLLPILVTWAGDTAAYFAGRRFGRRKLAPLASPGKTIEGSVAGLAGAVAAAVIVSLLMLSDLGAVAVPPATAAWMGLVLGAAAQVGDLAESVLKREAGVKDSGTLLPGHGGLLDRLDALLFSIPCTWVLLAVAGLLP